MAVRLISLGSGSHGNTTLVEFGERRVLVDAGLAARTLASRLTALQIPPTSIQALLLSHEHHDHARGAERFSRSYGVRVWCPRVTLEALDLSPVHLAGWGPLEPGRKTEIVPGIIVDPFVVPHDAVCPLGFVLEGEGGRVGIATDLGQATTLVVQRLRGCQLLLIESNHDDDLLLRGRYPWSLKQRVGGRLGHLSNDEAADLVHRTVDPGCRGVVLAHLSERNNTPQLAREATRRALRRGGRADVPLHVAPARGPSPAIVF